MIPDKAEDQSSIMSTRSKCLIMQNAGCRMESTKYEFGCWMLDAGCVGVGNWKQETNFITLRTL